MVPHSCPPTLEFGASQGSKEAVNTGHSLQTIISCVRVTAPVGGEHAKIILNWTVCIYEMSSLL